MSNDFKWCQMVSNDVKSYQTPVTFHDISLQWHIIFFHDISDHISCYEQYLGKWFPMNSDDFLITSNDYESLFIVLTSWIPASKNFLIKRCNNCSNYLSEEHLIHRGKLRESDATLFRFVYNLHQATHFYQTIASHTGGEQVRAEGPMRSEFI